MSIPLAPATIAALAPYFPMEVLRRVRLDIRTPQRLAAGALGCGCGPSALVKAASNPAGLDIVVDPAFYDPHTAKGNALIGHEVYHVWQRLTTPGFAQRFEAESVLAAARGQPQWANPYEQAAYAWEQAALRDMLARGIPKALRQAPAMMAFM